MTASAPIVAGPTGPLTSSGPLVGVLALQGDVGQHVHALTRLGARARPVRTPEQLGSVDALVIPGGESTTISRLLDIFALREPLRQRLAAGMPAYGSCAGMIILGSTILDGRPDQVPLGVLDITVRRNAFGRQVNSFEADVQMTGVVGEPVRGMFIRAPWVERVGDGVQVLATVGEHPVAVRQGAILATSFHPELGQDLRVHQMFLTFVRTAS